MMNHLRWIAPTPEADSETLVVYDLTRKFYREVEQREEFDHYCQWYQATADRHQKELQRMQGDINLFGWFCRGRRSP